MKRRVISLEGNLTMKKFLLILTAMALTLNLLIFPTIAVANESSIVNHRNFTFSGSTFEKGVAVKNDGSLWVWGNSSKPVKVAGDVLEFSCFSKFGRETINHILVKKTDGSFCVYKIIDDISVEVVATINDAKKVFINSDSIDYIENDGSLWSMKHNAWEIEKITSGSVTWSCDIAKGYGPDNVSYIASKNFDGYRIILKEDGSVWGKGDLVALGKSDKFIKITSGVVRMSGFLMIKKDGSAWYLNNFADIKKFEVGSGIAKVTRPHNPTGTNYVAAIIKNDGSIWRSVGKKIEDLNNIAMITTAPNHSEYINSITPQDLQRSFVHPFPVILKKDGQVWTAGGNTVGELGIGAGKTGNGKWNKVMGNVVMITGDEKSTLALKKDGTLWVLGYNANGQLGTGDKLNVFKPKKIMDNVKIPVDALTINETAKKSK